MLENINAASDQECGDEDFSPIKNNGEDATKTLNLNSQLKKHTNNVNKAKNFKSSKTRKKKKQNTELPGTIIFSPKQGLNFGMKNEISLPKE